MRVICLELITVCTLNILLNAVIQQICFSPVCKDIGFYKKMVAFVMAYSFTEHAQQEEEDDEDDGKTAPVMVPMADILNHIAKNNACLKFEKKAFKMVTTKPIKKVMV